MNANELITKEDLQYVADCRHWLHRHPELGFDLPETTAFVREKLRETGLNWTETHAKCSLAVVLNPDSPGKTLAIRADMDALPVGEETDVPFISEHPGKMHACGHDLHTAILLGVARVLKRVEDRLPCRVKLIFQPSEECEVSGAKAMVDGGVMDDVDAIICTHCDNLHPAGYLGCIPGDYMAACDPITIVFHGRSAHAAMPEQGIDAVAMGVEAYTRLKALAAEEARGAKYIFSVGRFDGGTAHNVIPERCELKISYRWYDRDFERRVKTRGMEICREIADRFGGSVDFDWETSALPVRNDERICALFAESAQKIAENGFGEVPTRMSSEDFAWYLEKAPGMIFRFGTRNEEKGCVALAHRSDFKADEDAMSAPLKAFVQFVFDAGGRI